VRDRVPVDVELARERVEECEPGAVRELDRIAQMLGIERLRSSIHVQDVQSTIADERRYPGYGVDDPLHAWPDVLRWRGASWQPVVGGTDEIEQVSPLDVVESQRP
jgi:hypothetical protein